MVTLGVLGMSGVVRADGGPFSIGGRGMYFSPADGDSSWSGGAQARLRLPLFFGAEASVDYRRTEAGSSTIHTWPVQLSGLIYLPKIILVQPFLLAGAGWYHTTVETPGVSDDTKSRFGPHGGAGVEFNLTPRVFLDATYRYIWLEDVHSVDPSGHMITAGLNFRL